jgi:branched-chain amino acid transport system permease protein
VATGDQQTRQGGPGGLSRSGRLDALGGQWERIPSRVRGALPAIVVITLAALYPLYVDSLPTGIPVIRSFPALDTGVFMIVYVIMAVGLNVVVGYAGLLDLGYVAFFAIGAYTAGWLASGHFQQVHFHFGSVGISEDLRGIHISIWLVLLCAAGVTAVGGIVIGLPTLRLRGDYLAIVTLGFGEIIPQVFRNADSLRGFDLTNGTFGINPIDSPGFGLALNRALGLPADFQTSFSRDDLF